jgi:steroid delta-isomerase-like uncharacterized protein
MIKLQRILKLRIALTQAMSSSAQEQQKNKQLVSQFFELLNRQDLERIEQLVSSSNYSYHFPGIPPLDWNGHKQFLVGIISAFPDFHHDLLDVVAEGDKVAVRFTINCTHKGEFQGIPPTSKKVSFGGMDFLTIIDGKITEEWVIVDIGGLMQQIGAIPATSPADSSTTRS